MSFSNTPHEGQPMVIPYQDSPTYPLPGGTIVDQSFVEASQRRHAAVLEKLGEFARIAAHERLEMEQARREKEAAAIIQALCRGAALDQADRSDYIAYISDLVWDLNRQGQTFDDQVLMGIDLSAFRQPKLPTTVR